MGYVISNSWLDFGVDPDQNFCEEFLLLQYRECDRSVETASWCFWQWCLRRILRLPYTAHVTNVSVRSNQPTPGFLVNTTTPPQAVWAYSSGCSLRGPLTCATCIHWSPPCWLASPKRPTSSVLASNNRQWSQTTQPWTSLCFTASNGSSFLAAHRGNGYALRTCHQMMMMTMMVSYQD